MDRIDHTAIVVENVPRAVRWYTENYDCKIKYKDNMYAVLEFENVDLAISNASEHPPHIAVVDESLEETTSTMKHKDGSIGEYVHDGFGNFVERIKYKK